MKQMQLNVEGMSCDHCKMAVTNALKELDGVDSVDVSVEEGKADVKYEEGKVTFDQMREAVEDQGYDVVA